ncbi:hypothetical protein [Priestia flexa]|uniref:hypothetical protein n=1 Tax=Priestia flexa TaxID=86664 RepID=UPI001F4C7D7E|nr:hypothetical protein [Priestia flexa]
MSNYNDIDIQSFVNNLTEKTKSLEIKWEKVPRVHYHKLIDRSIIYSNIKNPFYSQSKNGNVIIGKFDKKVYYEEDQYYYEDSFFITISNSTFGDVTTFLDNDDDNSLGFSFAVSLSKLHRLIQLNINDIKNRLDNWFD